MPAVFSSRLALRFLARIVSVFKPRDARCGIVLRRWVASALAIAALGVAHAADPSSAIANTPLHPRSGPRGATMFRVMPAAETGLVTENPYADPRMWSEHYQEFVYGATGCGIAAGDYDNDGRPDLYVVNKTGQCRLFRNAGHWKFEDVTEKAGLLESGGGWLDRARSLVGAASTDVDPGAWKQGAAFADVNNDGWLDIYVCRFNAPNLLYINQHDGTFKEEAAARGLAVVDASGMASFCDYDRDGWLDVYVQTNMLDAAKHPKGQRGYLFHNNRDGTFANVTDHAGIGGESCSHAAIWWDYDDDGWPDLYVTNDYAVPDRLYHNNRDGTFTDVAAAVLPHTPYYSMGADVGDVDNDGRLDLLAADMAASTHEKDQRGMAGSRERAQLPPTDGSAPQYMRSALYLNTGTSHMREAAYLTGLAATDWTWSVRFEDLDNDGRVDVHITNGMVREFHNADLLTRIMAADSIADSWRLVRSMPAMKERNFAFRNRGDLAFEDVSASWGLDQLGVSFGAAFADFDGDGDLDLAFVNYETGVTVLRNDCETGHRLEIALHGTRSNRFGVGATVRLETAFGIQVRTLVLARGHMATSEPILHFGLGDDPVVRQLTIQWPSGATQTFRDVGADAKLTITEPSTNEATPAREGEPPAPPTLFAAEPAGAASAAAPVASDATREQPFLPLRLNQPGQALAVSVSGANREPWLVVGGDGQTTAQRLRPNGDGGLTAENLPVGVMPGRLPDGPILLFDANGDGAADVLITKAGVGAAPDYQPALWLGDGKGGWQRAPENALPSLPICVGAVAAADFNRDGRLDVFVGGRAVPGRYPLSPRSALLVNRNGTFEDVTAAVAPGLGQVGMVTSALWTDVDGDGWVDLVVTLDWGAVKLFHNDQGRSFTDWTEKSGFARAGAGWWTSIASADFNGDGRPDYVIGNLGLNTRYHADSAHPALLFYGDFARNGSPFLLEGYEEGDRLYPWVTRNALAAKLPAVRQRFRRNDLYASATLPEIVGADELKQAQRFAATELRSGVLLSQSDGTYRFEPLPRIAQISPFQGVVAGDFDGDGCADIFAVQNSYAPAPSIGAFDGGLGQLLRGDGHGHFTAVPPAESGLVAPGDAKALVTSDLNDDGWPDFVATRNGAPVLAFRNRGAAGRHALRVELAGSAGNPTAVGARVTLELADGARELSEISAGGGYMSQSLPAGFFGYPDANPPRRVIVRWPDGATTAHAVAPGAAKVVLQRAAP